MYLFHCAGSLLLLAHHLLPSAFSAPPPAWPLSLYVKMCTHPPFICFLFVHLRSSTYFVLPSPSSPSSSDLLLPLPNSPFHILCLFEGDSKFAVRLQNIQPRPLNHINDSFLNQNCNYTGERLLGNIVVQPRGEPTTTANLSKGECSSVRGE